MREVDERIVQMEFDNRQFEANIGTTISSLEKLKGSLNFSGATEGLDAINAKSSKIDFSALTNSLGSVMGKFNSLEVMAVTTLANITNSAVNAGKKILRELTIDPISTGFNEYELKMDSIQTIMASTGESVDTVNKYLKELNEYSDKTIYSFADMTNNIGKFTNAGVKLEDAVSAIKGVSNVAAVSGANANEASRAMYNFAQALSAGYVKLIDWKSIENANMATVEFKTQLMETAVSLGTVTKTADGMYKTLKGNVFDATSNFNEVLQDQWMTSEVLVETLKNYADETTEIGQKAYAAAQDVKTFSQLMDTLKEAAQSGWSETWELIVGDINEAKAVFKELSDIVGGVIADSAEARNSLLGGALNSKWDEFKDAVADSGISVNALKNQIIDVARTNGIQIDKMIEDSGSFEESLKQGWLTADIVSDALMKMADETDKAAKESKIASENFINLKQSFADSLYDMDSVMNRFTASMSSSNQATVAAFDALGVQTKENTEEIKSNLDDQVDAYRSSLNKSIDAARNKNDEEIDAFKKTQEEETEVLNKSLDAEMDALEKSLDEEMNALETAHDAKLKLIDDEYTEKLKLLDEDKYRQIKAIEDEIKALDDKTEAENKAEKEAENSKKRLELQKKVSEASDAESRKNAQEALAEFEKKLEKDKLLEERKQRKSELNEKKKEINEQYDLEKKNLQEIKETKKKEENDQYELAKKNLKDVSNEEKKALKEVHDEKKNALKDEHETKLKNLKAEKDAEIDAIKEANDASLKSFKRDIDAQKDALKDTPMMRDANVVFQETIEALDKIEDQEEKARYALAIFGDTLGSIGDETDVNSNKMRAFAGEVRAAESPTNKLISMFTQSSGRDLLIDSVKNILISIINISKAVKDAWNSIMPEFNSEKLYNIIKSFNDFTIKLKDFTADLNNGEDGTNTFKSTLRGLFSILKIGIDLLKSAFDGVKKILSIFGDVGKATAGVSGSIGEWLVSVEEAIRQNNLFEKIFGKIADIFLSVSNGIKAFANGVRNAVTSIGEFIKPLGEKILYIFDRLKSAFKSFNRSDADGISESMDAIEEKIDPLSKTIDIFKMVMDKLAGVFKKSIPVFTTIGNTLKNTFSKIGEVIGGIDTDTLIASLNTGSNIALTGGILSFVKQLKDGFEPITGLGDSLKGILGGLKDTLQAYQNDIKAETLLKIAEAVGILAVALLVLSTIDPDRMTGSITAMAGLMGELMGSMAIFTKIAGAEGVASLGKLTAGMLALSVSVLILSSAVKILAGLSDEELSKGLVGVGVLIGELTASVKILSSSTDDLIKGSGGLLVFAASILVLTSAVKKLGELDTSALIKGLIGVGVLMGELVAFLKLTDVDGISLGKGLGILTLSAALLVMSSAVKKFSELDTGAMIQGLIGVGVVLGELAGFMKLTGDSKKVLSTAVGLTVLGAAMLIFAEAVRKFGELSVGELVKGLIGMGGALAIIAGVLNIIPKDTLLIGAGLLIVAAALNVMASAINDMGQMTWEQLAVGLIALAGSLGIIAIAVNTMTTALPGAAALLVVAAAIAIFTPALKSLGDMSWESIGKGLIALAGAFAVFGVAALVLTPLIPIIVGLGGAIALLGIGVLACGAGVLAFSAGLTALALAGTGAAATIAAIVSAVCGLIPVIASALAEGIVALIVIISESGSQLSEAIGKIIISLCDTLTAALPSVIELIKTAVDYLLELLLEYVPKLADVAFKLFIAFLDTISENIPKLIDSAVCVITTFLKGLADQTKDVVDMAFYIIITFINGLADSIRENTPLLVEAVGNLIDALIDAALTILEGSVDIIKKAGKKIMDNGLVKGISDGIKNGIEKVKEAGANIINGLKDGITEGFNTIKEKAAELGENALEGIKGALGIHSPSTEFAMIGRYADEGLINGFKSMMPDITNQVTSIGETAVNTLSKSFSDISDCIDSDMNINPTISPVLDLSNIDAGAKSIDAMMNRNYAMSISGSMEEARNARSETSDTPSNNSSSFVFNQYNTSPKALSRKEIRNDTLQGLQLARVMR